MSDLIAREIRNQSLLETQTDEEPVSSSGLLRKEQTHKEKDRNPDLLSTHYVPAPVPNE